MDHLDILRQSWLFSELTTDELEDIFKAGDILGYEEKDQLLEKGKGNDSLWLILNGKVSILQRTSKKPMHKVADLQSGAIIGEMSWLDGQTASSWAVCAEASSIFKINFKTLNSVLHKNPTAFVKVLLKFGETLSRRLRQYAES